jgi:hypothetical protein
MIRILNKTPELDLHRAAAMTAGKSVVEMHKLDVAGWTRWFKSEHSPVRVLQLEISATRVSERLIKHITRHKIGVEFFVSTRREDRCSTPNVPYNFIMVCNPQALINMARKRLCRKAHKDILQFFIELKQTLEASDIPLFAALGACLVPDCQYRGQCNEFKSC